MCLKYILSDLQKMNSSFVIIFALVVAVATAAPRGGHSNENNSNGNSTEFAKLTADQRTCIASAVKADTTIIAALKNCHTTHGGLTCVKAIPALASCFATSG